MYDAHFRGETDYVDSLLEFKFALLLDCSAEELLAAFYRSWKGHGHRDYAMFFKLRRWLEQRIRVTCFGPNSETRSSSLQLGYSDLDVLKRSVQNTWFQSDLRCKSLDCIKVSFEWTTQ